MLGLLCLGCGFFVSTATRRRTAMDMQGTKDGKERKKERLWAWLDNFSCFCEFFFENFLFLKLYLDLWNLCAVFLFICVCGWIIGDGDRKERKKEREERRRLTGLYMRWE